MGALLLLGCMDMLELEIDPQGFGREEACVGTTIRGFALHVGGVGGSILTCNFVY